jgi:hypothetical protein
METDWLRGLLDAPGPFVSLYIDDITDSRDSEKQAASRWSAIHHQLTEGEVAEHVIEDVERAVLGGRPGMGMHGRGIIAGGDGVLINQQLPAGPPYIGMTLRISAYPYLLPLLDFTTSRPSYVFASVDHLGADLTMHHHGAVEHKTVVGEGFPVHKPVSAGWNGYGDMQSTTEEAIRTNVRAIADGITEMADRSRAELTFLCGEVRSRAMVVSTLPKRIAERVVALPARAQGGRATERDVEALIDEEFARRKEDAERAVTARFEAEAMRSPRHAVQGLSAVCAALREGAVDTLIVGDVGSTTVVIGSDRTAVADDADALSEYGEAPTDVARADEALPFAALAGHASVTRPAGDVGIEDGVGALLRYPHAGVVSAGGSATAGAP